MLTNLNDFKIAEYINHSSSNKRFARSSFFNYTIIIDTWSNLINATKFCNHFHVKGKENVKKRFDYYSQTERNKKLIEEHYKEIATKDNKWKAIYTFYNGLYIIKGGHKKYEELRGTYVHYYSIIDLAVWCDRSLYRTFHALVVSIHNFLQVRTEQQITMEEIERVQREVKILADYMCEIEELNQNTTESTLTLMDIFKKLFPNEKFDEINNLMFRCGNILIITEFTLDWKNNLDNLNFTVFNIIVSFINETSINEKEFIVNFKEVPSYIDLLSNIFACYKDNTQNINKETTDNKTEINILINKLGTLAKSYDFDKIKKDNTELHGLLDQKKTLQDNYIEDYNNIMSNEPFIVNFDTTHENINSHRNKKKYSEYYDNGELNKIPQKLIILDHKDI